MHVCVYLCMYMCVRAGWKYSSQCFLTLTSSVDLSPLLLSHTIADLWGTDTPLLYTL